MNIEFVEWMKIGLVAFVVFSVSEWFATKIVEYFRKKREKANTV